MLPPRSERWVSGISWIPRPSIRMTVEAYATNYKDYPASTQFSQLSFANVGDTFNVRDFLCPMSSVGRIRSRGVEEVKALRFPMFFTLDLRVDRIFRVGTQTRFVYLGVQNVTGRQNPTGAFWNRLTNEAVLNDSIGRSPITGMEWSF